MNQAKHVNEKSDPDERRAFLLAEHACLQEKINHAASDLYRTETVIPLAIGVIYAWLYGGDSNARDVPDWIWWVPGVMAAFGAWRQHLRYISLWGCHDYLRLIEEELLGAESDGEMIRCHGWETYWLSHIHPPHRLGPWTITSHGAMRVVFWGLLIAGTVALAVEKTLL